MTFEYKCQSCQAIGDIDSFVDQIECPNCGGTMTPVNAPPAGSDKYDSAIDWGEPTIAVPRSYNPDETGAHSKKAVKVAKIVDIGFGGMLTTSATGGFKPISIPGNTPPIPFQQQPPVPQQLPEQNITQVKKEIIPEPALQRQTPSSSPTSLGVQRKKTVIFSKSKPAAPPPQHSSTPHMEATQIDPRFAATILQQQSPPAASAVQPQRDDSNAPREILPNPRIAGPTSTSLKFLPKGALKVTQTHTAIKPAQITPPPPKFQSQSQSHAQTQRQTPNQYAQHPSPFPQEHDEDFAAQVRIESERQEAILREAYHIAGEKIRKEKEEREAIQARKFAEEAERAAKEAAEKRAAREVAENIAAKEAGEKRAAREAAENIAAQIAKERAETEELLKKERAALELRKKELLEMKKRAEAEEAERAEREAAEKRAAQFAKERAETEELLRKEREALELSKKELLEIKKSIEEENAKAKQIQYNKITEVKIEKTEDAIKSQEPLNVISADAKKDDVKIKEPEKTLLRPTPAVSPKAGEGSELLTVTPENLQSNKKRVETEPAVLKKEELEKRDSKLEGMTEAKKNDVTTKKSPIKGLPPPFNKQTLRPPPLPTKTVSGKSVADKESREDLEKGKASGSDIAKTPVKDKTETKIGINTNLNIEGIIGAKKDDANVKKSPLKGLPPPSPFNKKGIRPTPPFPTKTAAPKSDTGGDDKEDLEKGRSSGSDIKKDMAKDKTQTKIGINTTIPITNTTLVKIQNKKRNIILLIVGASVLVICLLIIFIGGKVFKIAKSSFRSSPPVAAPSTTVQKKLPVPVVQGGIKTGSPLEMDFRTIYLKIKKAPPATTRQQIDAIIKEWQDFIDSHPNASPDDKCIKDANTQIKNMQDMKELYNK